MADHGGCGLYCMLPHRLDEEWQIMVGVAYILYATSCSR